MIVFVMVVFDVVVSVAVFFIVCCLCHGCLRNGIHINAPLLKKSDTLWEASIQKSPSVWKKFKWP